jgi:insertion element IS1 protein InsB
MCKDCGYQFTRTKRRGVDPALRKLGVLLYAHLGLSMRGISKLFKVSTQAVLKWIRAASECTEGPIRSSAEIVHVDEMWHFVNEKTKIWIWRAVCGVSRRSLGWQLGNRSDASLKELIHRVDNNSCIFVIDEWDGFFRCLPENRHFFGKDLTVLIEQTNSDIRHRLARFKRKTKASSRSVDMVHRSLKLFHYFQDALENVSNFMEPFLSFFG